MKYNRIFALFFLVFLIFSQPGLATIVYNKNYVNHSIHHSSHSHSAPEIRKCKPPEEEVLNINSSSRMFLTGARRNIQIGKSSNIIYEKPITFPIQYGYTSSNNNQHLPVLSMLILFPFHAFW